MKTLFALLALVVTFQAPAAPAFGGLAGLANAHPRASAGVFDWGDCIHYYALGEASGQTREDTIGSLDLIETSDPVATNTMGKRGVCVDFVAQPLGRLQTASFANPEPCSLSFWFKVTTYGGKMICLGDFAMANFDDCGPVYLIVVYGSGGVNPEFPNDLAWHHIVLTRNVGHEGKLYLDGSQIFVETTTFDATELPLEIGRLTAAPSGMSGTAFEGQLDEIAIFNKVLSATDVDDLWNGGAGLFYTP